MNTNVICWQFAPLGSGVGAYAGDGWGVCLKWNGLEFKLDQAISFLTLNKLLQVLCESKKKPNPLKRFGFFRFKYKHYQCRKNDALSLMALLALYDELSRNLQINNTSTFSVWRDKACRHDDRIVEKSITSHSALKETIFNYWARIFGVLRSDLFCREFVCQVGDCEKIWITRMF